MKNRILITKITGIVALILAICGTASAQSSDALIDKLVEKGILSVKEANDLREEADKGFTQAYSVKSGMPEWVNSLKFNGDVRLRYDGIYIDDNTTLDRHRFRYRLRFGVTAMMADNLETGLRLISGSGDPVSGNATLEDNGSKKFIGIDLVYAKWSPINTPDWNATIIGGKIENPFVFSDMVFDGDYTPEGAASQVGYNFNERHSAKLNLGGFVLDESGGTSSDPFWLGAQLRLESMWSPKWQSSFGIAGLMISGTENLISTAVPDGNNGNTRIDLNPSPTATTFALTETFNPVVVDGAVTYNLDEFPMYPGMFPIRLTAEYANNPAASDNNEAYTFGITFGKSGKRGTWDLTYRYKYLESDFWFEELVDSDTGAFYKAGVAQSAGATGYQPGTNLRGHYMRAAYSPYDALTLSATYFLFDLIKGKTKDSNTGRLQVDASLKF